MTSPLPHVAPTTGIDRPRPEATRMLTRLTWMASIAAVVAVLAVRILGPSDLWDQTQPRTISYTTDILVNGNWALPVDSGGKPATKPPLYNWIAAPAVKALGFSSAIGHKLPSILALLASWAVVVWAGRWADRWRGDLVGPLAGLMFVCSYAIAKLGYLARPDMLLTFFLLLGWAAATRLLMMESAHRFRLASEEHEESDGAARRKVGDEGEGTDSAGDVDDDGETEIDLTAAAHVTDPQAPARMARWPLLVIVWLCIGLAGLTKGPPAVLILLYMVLGGWLLGGSWRSIARFGWWWGLFLAAAIPGAWLAAAMSVDADHVRDVLWWEEIAGRVSGDGPEGGGYGLLGLITGALHYPAYFLARFAPWSLGAVLAMIDLVLIGFAAWRCRDERLPPGVAATRSAMDLPRPLLAVLRSKRARLRATMGQRGVLLFGCVLMIAIPIVLFSLSSGKRADYIAMAYGPGAILAAWWAALRPPFLAVRARWAIPVLAALAIAGIGVNNAMEPAAPERGYGNAVHDFAAHVERILEADPAPTAVIWQAPGPVPALAGISETIDGGTLEMLLEEGEPFYVLAGRRNAEPRDWGAHMAESRPGLRVEVVARSPILPRERGFPDRMTLFRVVPPDAAND